MTLAVLCVLKVALTGFMGVGGCGAMGELQKFVAP